MNIKRRYAYKNGVVTTDKHPVLLQGQVIEILQELNGVYEVRVFLTGQVETIEKESVLVN